MCPNECVSKHLCFGKAGPSAQFHWWSPLYSCSSFLFDMFALDPLYSGSADSPFPSSSLCSSSNLLILHSSLYSTFLSLLFFCFSSTLPIFVSTLLCSSHLHSPLPFPLFSTLDSTLHCSSCILFILSTLVYAPIFCKSSWRFWNASYRIL
jgi:hypothetical protein